jgi:ubiquinone biosynthesis monooxygenase Coq7
MSLRHLSPVDRLLLQVDQAMRTVFGAPITTGRPDPAEAAPEHDSGDQERRESVRLMRVNHCGEICAQALYQGQALTARTPEVREAMRQASAEENDHLDWCAARVHENGGRTTLLGPLFYLGSLGLGAAAGIAGDRWSLGFLAETEHQVVDHLEGHLQRLPATDAKSRAVVEQMIADEAAHATTALQAGGAELPAPVRRLMGVASKVMTGTTYWI